MSYEIGDKTINDLVDILRSRGAARVVAMADDGDYIALVARGQDARIIGEFLEQMEGRSEELESEEVGQ